MFSFDNEEALPLVEPPVGLFNADNDQVEAGQENILSRGMLSDSSQPHPEA